MSAETTEAPVGAAVAFVVDPATAQVDADKLMRRLRRLADAIERVQTDRKAQIAEINDWAEEQTHQLEQEQSRLEVLLHPLIRVLVEHDPMHRKSVQLIHGTAGFRAASGGATVVEDADATMAWLEATGNEALIRVKREPAVDKIKAAFPVRGDRYASPTATVRGETEFEVIPGLRVNVSDAPDVFFVKPARVSKPLVPPDDG